MRERASSNQINRPCFDIGARRVLRVGWFAVLISGGTIAARADEPESATPDQPKNARQLLALHLGHAEEYEIYRNSDRLEKLELERKPVYVRTNPLRSGGQNGAVFVWTYRGRAEVIGSIFSYPAMGRRQILHELHSLSSEILVPVREGPKTWQPKAGF